MSGKLKILEKEVLLFIRKYAKKPCPEAEFNHLAVRIFQFQYLNNGYYRRFCDLEGYSFQKVNSWKKIPAIPALAFKELKIRSFPVNQTVKVFKTSGTTRGKKGAHYFRTLDLYEASVVPACRAHLFYNTANFKFYFLMNSSLDAPASSLSHMMKIINQKFGQNKGRFYIRKNITFFKKLALDLSREKKKVFLFSTAFSLKSFLDYLTVNNIALSMPAGSRLMETGGFKGRVKNISKNELYALIRARLGIPVKNCFGEYGMTELSSQYFSRAMGPMKSPAWIRHQLVDPQSGKEVLRGRTGLIKHVDLANLGSVIAIQTEDLARQKGSGFELIGRAAKSELRGCSLAYEKFIGEFE